MKNEKHPDNSSSSNYLNRYWSVSQSGISNINCDVEFTYTNDDIIGLEVNMVGAIWNGEWWSALKELSLNKITGPVYGFSDFTGGELEVLSFKDFKDSKVNILVQGKKVKIISTNDFPIRKIEVFNKLGQYVQVITPANALNYEFNVEGSSDIYFLRVLSDQNSKTKKIFVD